MTPDAVQLYKLIILYFLKKTGQPTSNAILSDFILEEGYTDYFSIQETLTQLCEDRMILTEQTHKTSYYVLGEIGEKTLDFFGKQLPDDTKHQIEAYLTKHHLDIVSSSSIKTDYTQVGPEDYLATGSLLERGTTLMEVTMNVPSEEDAVTFCQRFEKKHEEVFQELFRIMNTD